MESFEQSYATLPQDLVGNLRPAAREIGFIRSLSPSLSPSVFQSSSQRDCPKLRLSSPPDERPHPAFPHALSFVTAWRIVSRVSRFSTPLCFIVLLPSPRYSKESILRRVERRRNAVNRREGNFAILLDPLLESGSLVFLRFLPFPRLCPRIPSAAWGEKQSSWRPV